MEVTVKRWSLRKSLVAISFASVAGILFYFVALSDELLWKSVYSQVLGAALRGDFVPATPRPFIHLLDLVIIPLLVPCWFGIFNILGGTLRNGVDRLVISVFLVFTLVGFFTIVLAMANILFQHMLIIAVLASGIALNIPLLRIGNKIERVRHLISGISLKPWTWTWKNMIVAIPIVLTFSLSFFYSLLLPVMDFDALIYHAEIAKILFEEHSMPTFKGPSVGIEISGNYPPLFSAIGAGMYTLLGRFEDAYLRILPGFFGFIFMFGTYRISEGVFRGSGKYSLLLILSTPLFVHNLVITSTTMLFSSCIVLSMMTILSIKEPQPVTGLNKSMIYLLLSGLFMGLALLSSYQSLFYIAIPILTYFITSFKKIPLIQIIYGISILAIVALTITSIWYGRNLAIHGNPFYPWLSEPEGQYAEIFDVTKEDIQAVGSSITFGRFTFDFLDIRTLFRFHPVLFPAFSAMSIIGVILFLHRKPRPVWVLAWILIPLLLILALGTIFPRYLMPLLPPLSISFGILVATATQNYSFPKIGLSVTVFLIVSIYLLVGLPVAIANPAVNMGNLQDRLYFARSGGDSNVLSVYYNGDIQAWRWISENAHNDAKVATYDPRIYSMGSHQNIVPLDGAQAVPLYSMTEPEKIRQYLEENDISYIFDSATSKSRLWFKLPLTKYLGNDEFPELVRFGESRIYSVSSIP